MLATLLQCSRELGLHFLEGTFIPTAKNGPAKNFFADHQFELIESSATGSRWRLDVERNSVVAPPWIRISRCKDGIYGESLAS
jgi:predicted enzyme involved in methoxymalonyl-ACP biosynthesis